MKPTEETIKQAVELYTSGLSLEEVGHQMKRGYNHIRLALRYGGVEIRTRGRRQEVNVPEVVQAYATGKSARQIGFDVKRDPHTILRVLRRNGVEIRSYARINQDEVVRQYESGIGCHRLGRMHDCSKQYICAILRGRGVQIRGGPKAVDVAPFVEDHKAGLSIRASARKRQTSQKTVRRALQRAGIRR